MTAADHLPSTAPSVVDTPRRPGIDSYDDELARLDAVATIDALDRRELSVREVVAAAVERSRAMDASLGAVAFERYDAALSSLPSLRSRRGSFTGIPTFIKDMVPVAGLPLTWGSQALTGGSPKRRTAGVARDIERMGMPILGSSSMPEWGFVPSTEFPHLNPTRNPWNPGRTVGGSSGGAAALVASGVVPVAHAVDGGGSIRIPAACAGLVGLKPSLGRLRRHADEKNLPVSVSVDGVVSRTVRDTARWYAEMERVFRPRGMAPMGEVTGPPSRRLRIGVLGEIPGLADLDGPTRATLAETAALLESLGHHVDATDPPVEAEVFRDDFVNYYRFLVFAATSTARFVHGPHFRKGDLIDFSKGMAGSFRSDPMAIVGSARRLRRTRSRIAGMLERYDVFLSPTVSRLPPELGFMSPDVDFETLLERIAAWMPYTPLANAAGTPSITLPMGFDDDAHLPVGAMISAGFGDDALLVQLGLELEQARPWDLTRLH